ncbi:MAG: hydrogenase nickel incorporation protein HypB [Gemmatimonadetes bacterium]|uniref:Hydrogenase nickel incorporation protein HypB n=1 Tax=Candidatus Kutchimonas denitrificans TaxID=3056748 RepID=A0AAE4Z6R3_9BACT|nr:hydrogenase nickel incorporation protein HypB [Gemmatimonadota bacterium]NIR74754.1 hydrogenase nickel incorporation protein HypB [Candidatus Kutchimonas denitrificans]NIS01504.1 hydrogenase nickel incorporation protein HypB [Gemmatimonadota bacterium]NIT67245.1 hydrogenase nickel incorporation protein HypB [Gemmatimonadota bacterium]NIU52419.1 hydrogenase nickel incorporation protein HypB [Gemmatimonadota bacterium]
MTAERVEVKQKVLSANDRLAAEIRADLTSRGVLCLNLISSPGSGKTTLLEKTIDELKSKLRLAVVAGDVQTRNDAERLERHGVPVEAIETGGGCHLNAEQVSKSLSGLGLSELDLLFVENVGNLVCPSSFDLGESMKVVLMSVTEGEDKPLKYPAAFRRAGALVLTKIDLIPHLQFSAERAVENARSINPELEVFATSSFTGEGLAEWLDWLLEAAERKRSG